MERKTVQKAIWYGVAAGIVYFSIRGVIDYRAEKKIYDTAKKAYDVALAKVDPQAAAKWDYRCMAKGIDAQRYRVNQLNKKGIWYLNQQLPPWETNRFEYQPIGFDRFWETELTTGTKEALSKAASKIGLSLDQAREQIRLYDIPKFENPYPRRPNAPSGATYAGDFGILSAGLLLVGGIASLPKLGIEMLAGMGLLMAWIMR